MSVVSKPAFPVVHPAGLSAQGMTLREYYAGLAMQGLLSNLAAIRREGFRDHEIEEFAVMRADALIAALEKGER